MSLMVTLSLFNTLAIGMMLAYFKGENAGERSPNLRSDSDGNYIRQRPRDLQVVESGLEVAFSDGVRHHSNSLDESLTARTVPGL